MIILGKFENLKGKNFGKLTVLERIENKGEKVCWICFCECGNYKNVLSVHLKDGAITNCGCVKKQIISKANTKHGKSNTRLFRIYSHMKDRCYRKNDKRYKNYGGRGIKICDEWLNDFMNFYNWAMKNGYQENLTIDRINVNGNYEPSNCRWASIKDQMNNTTRNVYLTYNNETHTISEWSEIIGIPYKTLQRRLNRKWTIERALTQKKRGGDTHANIEQDL